jgi:outer membrane receptor protein involved in Fe transport
MTRHTRLPSRTALATATLLALLSMQRAIAQEGASATQADAAAAPAQPAASAAAPADRKDELQTVVVTGTARAEGLKKIDAPFSITTADAEQIKNANPASAADLLKIVPGVMTETTGGQTGNNIEIRGFAATGDAPWITFQLNGSAMYPVPTLSFFEGSSMFRLDDTIDHVEVLRGGSSPIYGDGQPGATANFIMKKGGEVDEGDIRLTTGTGSLRRVDAYFGGKLAEGWYYSTGGFYRTDQGIRNTQFPADRGGQWSAMLTHKLEDGEVSMYGRWLDDKNTWYLPIPLLSGNGGHTLSSFPGFPAQNATFIGNDNRLVNVTEFPGDGTFNIDMANGRGAQMHLYGLDFDKKLAGWQISDKANYLAASMPTNGWVTGGSVSTLDDYIAAHLNGGTGGSGSFVNGGGAVPGDTYVWEVGAWQVSKELKSFTNDFRISRDLGASNTVTLGSWFADYSADELWYLGNNFLLSLYGGRPIDVSLTGTSKVLTRNGQLTGSTSPRNSHWNGQNLAFFLADEWKASSALTVDGGLRYETRQADGNWENSTTTDLDGNPDTLYDNSVDVFNGTYNSLDRSEHKTAWTAGANYKLQPDLSVFVRVNSGYQFQMFDNLQGATGKSLEPATVKQYEMGLKTVTKPYSAFVTLFENDFGGLNFTQTLTNGSQITNTAGSRSKGIEAELAWRPLHGFEIAFSGDYLSAHYTDYKLSDTDDRTGNQVIRQPKLQYRVTPSYRFNTGVGSVRLYATYSSIGERYNDDQNLQILPKYNTLDAGVVAHLDNGIDLRLTGTNLTNTIGITEGNTRVTDGGTVNGVFLGRPIFGRAYELSVGYAF